MSDLLPCPFCGGLATISKQQDESLWSHDTVWYSRVMCRECDAETLLQCDDPDAVKSIAAWNRRTSIAAPTPAVEAQSVPVAMTFEQWFDDEFPAESDGCRVRYRNTGVMDLMRAAWDGARAAVQGSDGPAITADVHRDAERYLKLREQVWNTSNLFVVAGGRECVKLGVDCPCRERLDQMVDALPERAARNANSGDTES